VLVVEWGVVFWKGLLSGSSFFSMCVFCSWLVRAFSSAFRFSSSSSSMISFQSFDLVSVVVVVVSCALGSAIL